MPNRDNTAFENHSVLAGILAWWNLSWLFVVTHSYTLCTGHCFFLSQGKEKPYLFWFCTDSTHIFYFSFFKLFFFSDKRKIIVGLPNMKTIITVEHQDINQTLGLHNLYGSISNQNFNLAFSKDRRRVVAKDFSW